MKEDIPSCDKAYVSNDELDIIAQFDKKFKTVNRRRIIELLNQQGYEFEDYMKAVRDVVKKEKTQKKRDELIDHALVVVAGNFAEQLFRKYRVRGKLMRFLTGAMEGLPMVRSCL